MRIAIDAARNCNSENPTDPKVGAVAKLSDGTIVSAYRGEIVASFAGQQGAGDHAEYTLLHKKLPNAPLAGATLYVTLEPCSTGRTPPKVPCVNWLIQRKVGMVWMGMLDPDPRIQGEGQRILTKSEIQVQFFPLDLTKEIEDLNSKFISDREEKKERLKKDHEIIREYIRESKESGAISEEDIESGKWGEVLKGAATNDGAAAPGNNAEPQNELNRPALDDALDHLGEDDRDVRRRLLGYSRWYDPAEKTVIFEKLAEFGYSRELVESNTRRLVDSDLIKITENHYLPLNQEICQQAAETMMDEFLSELED